MLDSGYSQDGYKALLLLEKRFDARTSASLLSHYLDVVTPTRLRTSELITGIHGWETKLSTLKSRYNENLGGNLKLAIFVGDAASGL